VIPHIATVAFLIGIAGLFALDRQAQTATSKALWIPTMWLLIGGSRNVGEWLQMDAPMDQGSRYLEGSPLDRAVLGTLIALGLAVLFTRRGRTGDILRANAPVLLYFVYCALSSVWSDYPDVAFKRWIRGAGDLVMVLVILTDMDWVAALKRVLARTGFLLLPLSVLLIRYYPYLGRGYNKAGTATFWTGVTTDKNGLGMICLIFGLGGFWRFLELYKERKQSKQPELLKKPFIALSVLVLTTFYLLWESNSMTSISCFVLASGLMLITGRSAAARKPVIVSLLAISAVAISAFVLFGGGGSVLEALGRNPTLTGRTEVWHVLLPLAENPVVGTGYESFWLGERLLKIGRLTDSAGIQEAHNGYLEIYLNLGWVGITLLAIVVLTGLRKVTQAVGRNDDTGKLRLAYFVIGLIYNFTEAGFKMMNPVWVFFLLAIMAPKPVPAASKVTVDHLSKNRFGSRQPKINSSHARVPRFT
jgi:exopolysaccharide production protein ExoQ